MAYNARHCQKTTIDKPDKLLLTCEGVRRGQSGLPVFLPTLQEKFMNLSLILSVQKKSTQFVFNKRYLCCYTGQSESPNLKRLEAIVFNVIYMYFRCIIFLFRLKKVLVPCTVAVMLKITISSTDNLV